MDLVNRCVWSSCSAKCLNVLIADRARDNSLEGRLLFAVPKSEQPPEKPPSPLGCIDRLTSSQRAG